MKKVWECNSEIAKAAARIKNSSSDGAVERFDGEDGSFSRKDFWMGMNYASRKGGEIRQIAKAVECGMEGSLASIDLSTLVIARP